MATPEQIEHPELRELVQSAHGLMRSGKATDAVRTLANAYLLLLSLKPELLDQAVATMSGRAVPTVMRWPALGANLTADSVLEKHPRIEFVRDRFALSEAMTYYEFTLETAIAAGA